ncbi:MoxR family ATPase [Rossellomorea marisflavi]|jgi:nitric oxide reductase NorQ protein|uniref:ATP-binding protein n=1 Tax=Rossellomorea marisflavi TaxID=189381 RepID=UPI0012F4624E|nr:MoxR family ATPase [Rossellomorea marisflavi]MDR4936707.1 MoxR family ATPase [Rossellomorea marisflavi]VXB78238.1 putative nitric-oxide reductase associated protein [Bacillus sp. 349Y]
MTTVNVTQLPDEIFRLIEERKEAYHHEKDHSLVREGGYTSSEDFIIEDCLISLTLGKNLLLKGPTGSGKTKLSDTLSSMLSQPMHSINCSVDLDAEALLGYKTIAEKDGKSVIEFIEGPVIQAMKKGHLLYIDEINMAKPETLPILNGVLDYRRSITNPFTGEVIKAEPSFGVIAAINEGYVGTVPMNEALKNRFVVVDVPYIEGDTLKAVIAAQSSLTDPKVVDRFVQLASDLMVQVRNGQVSEEAASIRALLDACDLAVHLPAKRAIRRGIIDKLEDDREKAAIENIADTLFE